MELQPVVFDLLEANMSQFGDRASSIRMALSDRSGELSFHIDRTNHGASPISTEGDVRVPVQAAGGFLRGMGKVDLIKIDVEGHELPIFQSMADELRRMRPRAILFEQQSGDGSSGRPIGSILKAAGYKVYGFQNGC